MTSVGCTGALKASLERPKPFFPSTPRFVVFCTQNSCLSRVSGFPCLFHCLFLVSSLVFFLLSSLFLSLSPKDAHSIFDGLVSSCSGNGVELPYEPGLCRFWFYKAPRMLRLMNPLSLLASLLRELSLFWYTIYWRPLSEKDRAFCSVCRPKFGTLFYYCFCLYILLAAL